MQETLDSFVGVAQTFLEPHHGLAIGADAEMTGLDDAGMDRSDRQLVNVLSFDGKESVLLGWPSIVSLRGKRGMHAPFPVIEPGARIRQADRNKCEQIGDGTFQADRRRMYSAHRRIAALRAREAQHQDAARVTGVRDGHMNGLWLAPEPEQGQGTAAQADLPLPSRYRPAPPFWATGDARQRCARSNRRTDQAGMDRAPSFEQPRDVLEPGDHRARHIKPADQHQAQMREDRQVRGAHRCRRPGGFAEGDGAQAQQQRAEGDQQSEGCDERRAPARARRPK